MFSNLKAKIQQKFHKNDEDHQVAVNPDPSVPPPPAPPKPVVVSVRKDLKTEEVSIADETDESSNVLASNSKNNCTTSRDENDYYSEKPNHPLISPNLQSPPLYSPDTAIDARHAQLSKDLERYYFGASYSEVNYAMTFLQERAVTQFPSSMFALAAAYPPLAHTMLALSDAMDAELIAADSTLEGAGNGSTTTTECCSSFDFLNQNALAFAAASAQGQTKPFLVGASLSQLLGMSSPNVSSPTGSYAARPSGHASPVPSALQFVGTPPPNGKQSPMSVVSNASRSSSLPRGPFWLYQTAFHDLPINVALSRDKPAPPDCSMTPSQFWALQLQLPLHCQRKRWRQIYNSRDHGFNLGVMKRLTQDQVKYVDRPCVLVMSVQTPDQSQKELATAIQLAAQARDVSNGDKDTNTASSGAAAPRYRPPTIVGAFFTGSPFKDGCQRKYFGQEGTFVFRSVFPGEEAELEEEEARKREANALREQKATRENLEKAERIRKGEQKMNPFGQERKEEQESKELQHQFSPQLAEPLSTQVSESDLFQTRARGFSFAPSPRLVPPVLVSADGDFENALSEDGASCNGDAEVIKPKHTLNVKTDAFVRDATEPCLTDYDFNLKFFKIPPRDDGPELEIQARHGAPTSSVYGPMLKLLRQKLSGHTSVAVTPSSSKATTPRQSPAISPSAPPLTAAADPHGDSPGIIPTLSDTTAAAFSPSTPVKATNQLPDLACIASGRVSPRQGSMAAARGTVLLDALIGDMQSLNVRMGLPNVATFVDVDVNEPPSAAAERAERLSIELLQSLFPCFAKLASRPNDYFMRYTDQQFFCGGGGEGPAILLSEDLAKCTSSPNCDTFGARKSLKEAKAEDDAIAQRLAVMLKLLSRVEAAPTLPPKRTKVQPIDASGLRSTTAPSSVSTNNTDTFKMLSATEPEMDAFTRIIHHYAATLQHRRSRSVGYYFDQALFSDKSAGQRRELLLPTLLQAYTLQQEQQKLLIENDMKRQEIQQQQQRQLASPLGSPLSPEQPSGSSAAADTLRSFTQRSASAILASTLNTINDASGPFSLANLDAFFSQSAADSANSAELHFEQQIIVECGMAEAQIQMVELWEITEDTF